MSEADDGDGGRLAHPDIDLVRIAALLRGVTPRVDEEARARLEAAWVALLNAMKQPKADATRLANRFGRLREELDALVSRGAEQAIDRSSIDGGDTAKVVHSQSAQSSGSGE